MTNIPTQTWVSIPNLSHCFHQICGYVRIWVSVLVWIWVTVWTTENSVIFSLLSLQHSLTENQELILTSPSSHQRQEEEVRLMHDNVWEIKVLKLHSLWRLQRISDRTENSRAILDADPLCVQTRDRLSGVKEAVACCPHKCQNPIHTLDSEHMGPPACTLIWSRGL